MKLLKRERARALNVSLGFPEDIASNSSSSASCLKLWRKCSRNRSCKSDFFPETFRPCSLQSAFNCAAVMFSSWSVPLPSIGVRGGNEEKERKKNKIQQNSIFANVAQKAHYIERKKKCLPALFAFWASSRNFLYSAKAFSGISSLATLNIRISSVKSFVF